MEGSTCQGYSPDMVGTSMLVLAALYLEHTLPQASQSISINNAQYVTLQKHILTSKFQLLTFFPTPPIKLKLGLQVGGRLLLIATHLEQSNYLANQKQGAINTYDFTMFIRLFLGSASCAIFQGRGSLRVYSLDSTDEPHLRFAVQGHILSVGGDALTYTKQTTSSMYSR